jgi:hypothetical protein
MTAILGGPSGAAAVEAEGVCAATLSAELESTMSAMKNERFIE